MFSVSIMTRRNNIVIRNNKYEGNFGTRDYLKLNRPDTMKTFIKDKSMSFGLIIDNQRKMKYTQHYWKEVENV